MRKWLVLIVVLVLSVGAVSAQDAAWSAYLYNSVTRQILRVDLDGTQTPIDLGLPEGSYLGMNDTDFTPSGDMLAYCVIDYNAAPTNMGTPTTLHLYSLTVNAPVAVVDLGASMGCWISYNAEGTMLAVGLVHYYSGDPAADLSQPAWELRVLDAASGETIDTLSPSAQFALDAGLTSDLTLMPDVRFFAGSQIIFAGIMWGTEGAPLEPAFLWDISTDVVQPFDYWWHPGLSVSGADLAWLDLDPMLPVGDPGGPVPQSNIVRMLGADGSPVTVYHSPDWILLDTEFVNNGRALALQLLEPFDPNAPMGSNAIRWLLLDRQGGTVDLGTYPGFTQVIGAPDGLLLLHADSAQPGTGMTLDYVTATETRVLWQDVSENSGAAWNIIWASPVPRADGLSPFPAQ
ncbi:MAG: hypothetical protein IAE80_15160 [Anaerolinea sp.]|nr:hypothetical protein [Anaerolinea sp.]